MPFEHNCNKHGACDHQEAGENAAEWSLFSRIDLDNVQCLNEAVDGSGRKVFRAWEDRLKRDEVSAFVYLPLK